MTSATPSLTGSGSTWASRRSTVGSSNGLRANRPQAQRCDRKWRSRAWQPLGERLHRVVQLQAPWWAAQRWALLYAL